MKRHLKIRGVLSPDRQSVTAYIVSQSHFGKEFGMGYDRFPSEGPIFFRTPAGFIYSYPYSSGASVWNTEFAFVLPGTPTVDGKEVGMKGLTLVQWKVFKQLVEAYNEWGASQ